MIPRYTRSVYLSDASCDSLPTIFANPWVQDLKSRATMQTPDLSPSSRNQDVPTRQLRRPYFSLFLVGFSGERVRSTSMCIKPIIHFMTGGQLWAVLTQTWGKAGLSQPEMRAQAGYHSP